jgi:hypothetical protein
VDRLRLRLGPLAECEGSTNAGPTTRGDVVETFEAQVGLQLENIDEFGESTSQDKDETSIIETREPKAADESVDNVQVRHRRLRLFFGFVEFAGYIIETTETNVVGTL